MIMCKWEELPDCMRTEEVKPYYDLLKKRTGSLILKRVFDIVFSAMLLMLIWPLFIIIAVAIKFDSKGPVFYRQTRITQYGKAFKIFKFRTMVTGADKIGTLVTVDNDSRITKVGAFLRRTKLDELGQLLDVFRGTMSFIGTRPEVPKYVEKYTPEMMATLLLPAGVTSLTSIFYSGEAGMLDNSVDPDITYVNEILPDKMRWNLKGIRDFSFFGDIKIILMTILVVFGIKYEAGDIK